MGCMVLPSLPGDLPFVEEIEHWHHGSKNEAVALAERTTGQTEMTKETAPELAKHGEEDVEASGHKAPRPSITEVAMQHTLLGNTLEPNSVEIDIGADSSHGFVRDIVVDLRSIEAQGSLDAPIELRDIRETPSVLDLEKLEPLALLRPDRDTALLDTDPEDLAPVFEFETSGRSVETAPLAAVPLTGLAVASRTELAAKRIMDISIALLTLFILLPFMVLIAVLIKTTSRGPVLYRSKRVGKDGEAFTLYKFRSMFDGAADERTSLEKHNEQSGPVFKMRDDPRITSFGRFLRKVSVDELPQLVNVLSGKMSLVGPRPALPEEVAQYGIRAGQRLAVKPGITCIWQVSGRSTIDFDTWIEMDVDYIRSWTLIRDMSLLIRTVPAVLSGRGAY